MTAATTAPQRLLSLDAFRGLVIVVMFLVNVGGTDPAFPSWFPHRGWAEGQMGNGLADFVFPCFLFIVGVSIPFSLKRGRGASHGSSRHILQAFLRGTRLYLLGSLLIAASLASKGPLDSSVFARWDILPLIGFASFLGVVAAHLPRAAQISLIAFILIFKWAILTQLRIPGHDTVVWTATESYQAYLRNELGWWGTAVTQGLPAAATTMLGALAGRELLEHGERGNVHRTLIIRGGIMIAASYLWHRWGGLPYSKDFFTSSYVLVAAGVASVVLGAMHWIIDLKKATTLPMLRHLGTNAIAVYVLAEFLWRTCLMQWRCATPDGSPSAMVIAFKAWLQHFTNPTIGSWLLVTCYIAFYWLIAWTLFRKNWFIKA